MKCIISSGVVKALCEAGEMQSTPSGTPRVAAISASTFFAGRMPPWPGLAPLAELDFNHFHLRALRLFGKAPRVEMAVGGAAAEIAAAQLPHQIAVVFPVIAADAALTGVVVEIALGRTEVERADGIGGERAEAHSRNVKDRRGVGLAAVGAADGDAETGRVGGFHRPHGVADALIAGLVDIQQGAERLVAHLVFRPAIHQRALGTRKRDLFIILLEEILAQFRTDEFEEEAQAADDRVVAADGVALLREIVDTQHHQATAGRGRQPEPRMVAHHD